MGFKASDADPALYIAQARSTFCGDILVAAKDMEIVVSVKQRLTSVFDLRDLGKAKYFLDMSLDKNRQEHTWKMSHQRLASQLVDKYGLKEGQTKSLPMSPNIKLIHAEVD